MNFIVERLNEWGPQVLAAGWSVLWQSSLLIGALLVFDFVFSRKLRPAVRYVLWLVVLAKLLVPPSLALPTGIAWWVRERAQAQPAHHVTVNLTFPAIPDSAATEGDLPWSPGMPVLSAAGTALAASGFVTLGLLGFLLWRWRRLSRASAITVGDPPQCVTDMLVEASRRAGISRVPTLRLVRGSISPALFGLMRPVMLLPDSLIETLSAAQVRSVLMHELIHLRRGDVWVNCAQALLQIIYWWHPLVWLANSRVRRVREEAVDEAVMLALRDEGEHYAPALLQVARLGLARPMASLGLVGILESHSALRQRIERLVQFRPPRRARITVVSILCGILFGAVALPMGQAPAPEPAATPSSSDRPPQSASTTDEAHIRAAKHMVEDGKLLFRAGKLDDAQKVFTEALQVNPREQAAFYYLNLIGEARSNGSPGLRNRSPARHQLYQSLRDTYLDTVSFNHTPLRDVVDTLMAEARKRNTSGKRINILLNTGTPGQPDAAEDLGDVTVWIQPQLTNITLLDALEALVLTASKPIKYTVEDYAVVLSFKNANETPPLYTRIIKVDAEGLTNALRTMLGEPAKGQEPTMLLRNFLTNLNVNLNPPKSVFLDARQGQLFARGTLQDLDTIEMAVQALNAPAQLNIKASFVELPENEAAAFWQQQGSGAEVKDAVRMMQVTRPQAQRWFEDWKARKSTEVLAQSSVTTLSGRQAQVQVVELINVRTFNKGPDGHWITNQVPVGPTLDVLPTVSTDLRQIRLIMTASVNEFLGYEQTGKGAPPAPHFRTKQLPASTLVADGQTLILGGIPATEHSDEAGKKQLLVMVTPTVIDAVGNRIHTDADVENANPPSRR